MFFLRAIILYMENKVSTGINGLDKVLLGGIPKNQLTFVEGCSGIGKTIFGLQFLKQGLYTDERVLFITAKNTPKQIREIISSLDWEIDWAFEQKRFFIVDIREYFVESDIEESSNNIFVNLLKEIKVIITNNGIKRVVVDPAFPNFVNVNGNNKKIYFSGFNDMIEKIEEDLTIVFITSNYNDEQSIEANSIKMYFEQNGPTINRFILPQKILFTDYKLKPIGFDIKAKDGIYINE